MFNVEGNAEAGRGLGGRGQRPRQEEAEKEWTTVRDR